MAVRLRLLGSPTLEREGEAHPLPFERRSQLLAYLALKRGWVGRAELAALLWPEQPEKLAYTNLRKTIFRLRSLPWSPEVEVHGSALRFEAATDVLDLEAALEDGRAADAARLRGNELLRGFDDDSNDAWTSWLAYERERLRGAWRAGVLASLTPDAAPEDGGALATRLLEADPLDEAALRWRMTYLARAGDVARARDAYREFAQRLQEELGLPPPAELATLHDSLGSPAAAAPAVRARDDGFVGRSVELRQIAALLSQPDCRLVTLVGPGGVGKTRLARRAMADLAAEHGSALLVELEEAATESDIASRVARELGLAPGARKDPAGEIARHVGDRRLLLVLDNFEHLANHAGLLGRLIEQCPGLRMIVTSRARLGIAMEQLLPVDGLPVPEPEDQDRFEAFDAVRLFVKAARRVEPGLVAEAEAAAITDICRQVDGLPLAIELAASWARVLSCEAIAAQLRDGLQLLRQADPARPARHASMQVVFDESWRVLGEAERAALLRLSVFEGGFSAEAAQAVAGTALPVLASLMDKSMLRKDGARLHLHPLVQQLAAQRLELEGLEEEARRAHAQYFHRLMAQLRRGASVGDPEALRALDREISNCRSAWRWGARRSMSAGLRGSLFALLHYCDHRFRLEEALGLINEAIESPAARDDPKLAALLHAAASHMKYRLDRYPEAEAEALAALAATRGGDDGETRFQAVKVLGGVCLRTARLQEAKGWFGEALALARDRADPAPLAGMLDNVAIIEKRLGNYDEALRLSQEALLRYRETGVTGGIALCLNNLGTLCHDRGEHDAAAAYLAESLVLCDRHGLANTRALVVANLVEVAIATGNLEQAETHAQDAMGMAVSTGARGLEVAIHLYLTRIALTKHDLPRARTHLAAGVEIALAIGARSYQFLGLACFADMLAAEGRESAAQALLAHCMDQPDIGAPERGVMQKRRDGSAAPAWNGPELPELLRRIVVEKDTAHAPLMAAIA